jgi:hypothetical protein
MPLCDGWVVSEVLQDPSIWVEWWVRRQNADSCVIDTKITLRVTVKATWTDPVTGDVYTCVTELQFVVAVKTITLFDTDNRYQYFRHVQPYVEPRKVFH